MFLVVFLVLHTKGRVAQRQLTFQAISSHVKYSNMINDAKVSLHSRIMAGLDPAGERLRIIDYGLCLHLTCFRQLLTNPLHCSSHLSLLRNRSYPVSASTSFFGFLQQQQSFQESCAVKDPQWDRTRGSISRRGSPTILMHPFPRK